jgi:class I fructose-bisphosphate aldolase
MHRETPSNIGKSIRLSRMLKEGKAIIFAFDHGFEHGPSDFVEGSLDPRDVVRRAVEAGFDAIMMNKGIAKATADLWVGRVPLILKTTGKTSLRPKELQFMQYPISSVHDAVALGADGVAGTVYWGAPEEGTMATNFARLVARCDALGLPSLILSYPRGPAIKDSSDPDVVAYAARASSELGADIIKTHYTGSVESFRRVVKVATAPVMLSGGVKTDDPRVFFEVVSAVLEAGGAGVVVGRNVFQSRRPVGMGAALRGIVHENLSPEEALRVLNSGSQKRRSG